MKFQSWFILSMSLFLFSACSIFSGKKNIQGPETLEMVPKSQYDQLLVKYEQLLQGKRDQNIETSLSPDKLNNFRDMPVDKMSPDAVVAGQSDLSETVDIFNNKDLSQNKVQGGKVTAIDADLSSEMKNMDGAITEDEIGKLKKAEAAIGQKKYDVALTLLRELDGSGNRQIVVRAKFNTGELLFLQNEYDLAMQIYEEVIQKYAFSGLVLKTLQRLIECSERLQLEKKQKQYYSILHDFFEVGQDQT